VLPPAVERMRRIECETRAISNATSMSRWQTRGILPAAELFAGNAPAGVTVMRINIWIILGMLLALFAITRYTHYQKDTERICAASV
jgi:hypothetical protein